jgi:hypothetical protein
LQAHCQSLTCQRLNQSFVKELTKPTRFAHRALGIANAQKNKINLCFVDSLVGFEKMIDLELNN